MPNRPKSSYAAQKAGWLGSAGRMVKISENFVKCPHFPEVNSTAYFRLLSHWFKFESWGSRLPQWLKWEWKLAFIGIEKYSFRAKIQKISQLKFGLYSKTVISALLNERMRWLWRGCIGECGPISWEIGVQYHPTAEGRRVVLHPNFEGRGPHSPMHPSQSQRIHIVI